MNLEALFSALTAGCTRGGMAAGPEPHAGTPGFRDWLREAAEPVSDLAGKGKSAGDFSPRGLGQQASDNGVSRRAAELTPIASARAIAFAERPLLVETSLEFGSDAASPSSRFPDIRWIAEVLQYRVADFLQRWTAEGTGDGPAPLLAPLPVDPDRGHRTNPGDKRLPIFGMVPVAQTASEASPLPAAERDGDGESLRTAAGRRDQTAGALAARLIEHVGRGSPNGPVVNLHPEQDGLWRLVLRLPKLAEGALANLREELTNLAEAFGLKLGTFEIVETRTGKEG